MIQINRCTLPIYPHFYMSIPCEQLGGNAVIETFHQGAHNIVLDQEGARLGTSRQTACRHDSHLIPPTSRLSFRPTGLICLAWGNKCILQVQYRFSCNLPNLITSSKPTHTLSYLSNLLAASSRRKTDSRRLTSSNPLWALGLGCPSIVTAKTCGQIMAG